MRMKKTRGHIVPLLLLSLLGVSCHKEDETKTAGGSGVSTGQKQVNVIRGDKLVDQFDAKKAMEQVVAQVGHGQRYAGSEALDRSREDLVKRLEEFGWEVKKQTFSANTPLKGEVKFANLRARYSSKKNVDWDKPVRALVGSHIDTKYYSYFEFVGANDSGSSTGVLVEFARILPSNKNLAEDIELVFFDGEECFLQYSLRDGLYGSRHYARWLKDTIKKDEWPRSMVVLDMVGDKDLAIRIPQNVTPALARAYLKASEEQGTRSFVGLGSEMITDDHEPFRLIGIPVINIIDLDYDYWHKPTDTLDKLSNQSLAIVGRTTLLFLDKFLEQAILDSEKN